MDAEAHVKSLAFTLPGAPFWVGSAVADALEKRGALRVSQQGVAQGLGKKSIAVVVHMVLWHPTRGYSVVLNYSDGKEDGKSAKITVFGRGIGRGMAAIRKIYKELARRADEENVKHFESQFGPAAGQPAQA